MAGFAADLTFVAMLIHPPRKYRCQYYFSMGYYIFCLTGTEHGFKDLLIHPLMSFVPCHLNRLSSFLSILHFTVIGLAGSVPLSSDKRLLAQCFPPLKAVFLQSCIGFPGLHAAWNLKSKFLQVCKILPRVSICEMYTNFIYSCICILIVLF